MYAPACRHICIPPKGVLAPDGESFPHVRIAPGNSRKYFCNPPRTPAIADDEVVSDCLEPPGAGAPDNSGERGRLHMTTRKTLSLLLVFAFIVTMFAAVPAFA